MVTLNVKFMELMNIQNLSRFVHFLSIYPTAVGRLTDLYYIFLKAGCWQSKQQRLCNVCFSSTGVCLSNIKTAPTPPPCQTSLHNADTKPATKQVNLCMLQLSGVFHTGFFAVIPCWCTVSDALNDQHASA